MPTTYRVLGQSAPAATTATTLYTVTAPVVNTIVSTMTVCNTSSTATSFRVAIRPAGAALAPLHYFAYDVPLAGNQFFGITLGITLAVTDVVTVYATAATVSFSLFGAENT